MTNCTDPNCSWRLDDPVRFGGPHGHLSMPDPEGTTRLAVIRDLLHAGDKS